MIAITLQFKSIEAARAALLDIPATSLVDGPEPEAAPAPKSSKPAKAPAPAAAPAPATAPATEAQPQVDAPAVPEPVAEVPAAVEYPVLQKAVFALAGKSREAAAAVAASFGVKTFKELDPSKWAEALAAVTAKLAEV